MVAHYNAAGHLAFSLITDLGNYSALYVHSSLVLNVRAVIGGVGLEGVISRHRLWPVAVVAGQQCPFLLTLLCEYLQTHP